jgi:hypothetical protein
MLERWSQGLQIGFPNWMVSFFQPWVGPMQSHKVQYLFSNLGKIEKFFSITALTLSVKALGAGQFQLLHEQECLI